MNTVQKLLTQLNLPTGDRHDLPSSTKRFPDGAHYRIEIPSTEGPGALQAVLDTAQTLGVTVHRVSQGSGMMLLREVEMREMAQLGGAAGVEICLFVGPRAHWEGTAMALVPDGKVVGWRNMGMDQLVYAYNDIERGVACGIRSILPADEGLIWLIDQARKRELLPAGLVMKGSALLGVSNPIQIRLLQDAGVNTINVASDSSLARLAAIRQVIDIPIDLYIEGPDGLGGFTRYHEIAEIIRVAAPVYLKFGLRNAPNIYPSGIHLEGAAVSTAKERVRRAAIGMEILARYSTEYSMSRTGTADLGVPLMSPAIESERRL